MNFGYCKHLIRCQALFEDQEISSFVFGDKTAEIIENLIKESRPKEDEDLIDLF